MSFPDIGLIYTTFASKDDAERVCRALIDNGHAGCANIFAPHSAIYVLNGKTQSTEEVAVLLKCAASLKQNLARELKLRHPYKTPAIIVLPATAEAGFASWLQQK
jgi:periplasmic divalent cation tolerance protein